jgi:hypothetical protein
MPSPLATLLGLARQLGLAHQPDCCWWLPIAASEFLFSCVACCPGLRPLSGRSFLGCHWRCSAPLLGCQCELYGLWLALHPQTRGFDMGCSQRLCSAPGQHGLCHPSSVWFLQLLWLGLLVLLWNSSHHCARHPLAHLFMSHLGSSPWGRALFLLGAQGHLCPGLVPCWPRL